MKAEERASRDDIPAGASLCPKCGAPVWAPCETPESVIGEGRVEVSFDVEGRTYTELYPPACLEKSETLQ